MLLTYLKTGVGSAENTTRSTLRFCGCFKTNAIAAIQSIKLVSCVGQCGLGLISSVDENGEILFI